MKIFKYRTFERWARKQGMKDEDLEKAILEIQKGLVDAQLGGNVFKKRIGLHGKGKRGSHRTIILMKFSEIAIFVHGFSKGEKGNITKSELSGFKELAEVFLNLSVGQVEELVKNKSLIEVKK